MLCLPVVSINIGIDPMDENLLDEWVRYLSCGKGYASASCDFAELIWSDAVTQQQQIELLKTGHANVRRAVAWAVTDLSLDNDAMRYLMNRCFNDSDAVVRRYVWGQCVKLVASALKRNSI